MYGITKEDITFIEKKLEYQKKYIINNFFDFGDENKNILDFTYSANLNPEKYFAEMNNRVNSIFEYSKQLNLKPVFATITAPSKYHQTDKNKKLIYSPNDTAKALTQILNKFTNLQIFQKMKKDLGHGLIYFRVYEPHKSGVPHCHIMFFLPKDYILEVKKKFYEYFTDKVKWGNNSKSLDFKYTFYDKNKNGDITGGAVAYMMKYITKTFRNPNDKTTQYAFYWYIKNRVRRFLTSRTLAPLEIYRKVRYFFNKKYEWDYLEVTKLLKENNIIKLFEKTTINYMFFNYDTGEVEEINLWQKNTDLILNARIKINQTIELKYTKKEYKKSLVAFVNHFEKYSFNEKIGKFVLMPVVPSLLTDYQLYTYFNIIDKNIENIDLVHYGITKNEMIKRGFIEDDYINPELYNINIENIENIKTNYSKDISFNDILEDFKTRDIEFKQKIIEHQQNELNKWKI